MGTNALKVDDAGWDTEVIKSPGLVMVDFWAVWCGPCQMVAPIVDELATEYAGKLKVMKLNTDENPEVAGRYQIMSISHGLVLQERSAGRKIDRRPAQKAIQGYHRSTADPIRLAGVEATLNDECRTMNEGKSHSLPTVQRAAFIAHRLS